MVVLRSGQTVDMDGRANKICWYIRRPGKQRKRGVKENPQVLDWTTRRLELAFTEKKKKVTGLGRTPRVRF